MSKQYKTQILKYLENYLEVAKKVKQVVKTIDPEAQLYVFGSVVRRRYTAASDIDILVITKKPQLKYEIIVQAYKSTEAPIELHVVTKELFEKWYKKFIDENELVEI